MQPHRLGAMFVALVAVAMLAPVLAAGRAIADDWIPIGDNGAIAVDTQDVFSSDTPLLGVRTTLGGDEYDGRVRHLGPLEFWTLAIPSGLAGGAAWGILGGVALVGIASLVAVGWASGRMTGASGATCALGLTVLVCWSLGRYVLADPWNPHVAVLPLVAALFLAWAVVAGDGWALAPLAFAVSFAAQAHFLYVPLALALLVGAAAAVARRATRRQLVTSVAVLAIVWLFPVWEQITNRPGNFVEVSRALRGDEQVAVSWQYAFRAVARAVGLVPLFGRPARGFEYFGSPLSIVTLSSAIAVVAGLAVLTVAAARRRDRLAWSAGAVALAALAVTTATIAQVPHAYGDVAFYHMLALWPVGCFTWFALGLLVVRTFSLPVLARRIGIGAAAALLVVGAPAVAFTEGPGGWDEANMQAVRALMRQVEPKLEDLGAVRIETIGQVYTPVLYGMVYQLRRRGIDARVAADDLYLGSQHAAPPDAPALVVVAGEADARLGPDAPRIASYRTWSEADLVELRELDRQLRTLLDASGIDRLRGADPYELYQDGTLLRLEIAGDLMFSDEDRALLKRYVDLRFEIEELVFVAYLVPGR